MAIPSPSEFQPYRRVQGEAERDLRRILELAAKQIRARVAALKPGVGGEVRKAQLNLTLAAIRKIQRSMWRTGVAGVVKGGIDDAQKAAESAIEAMTRVAYAALPDAAAEELVRGLRLAAASGIKSDAARRKRELSARVYRQGALYEGKVEDIIRQGLVSGLSAKELADDVYKFVSPNAPGGQSYSAMRLARTEINNAFHERQVAGATRPGVEAVQWNLSGSHKVPDECNLYAAHKPYPPDAVPDKPHPNCFCYLTYVTMPPAKFKDALAAGDFDDELARRTRENMARLGQPVGDIEVPKPVLKAVPKFDQKGYKPKAWERVTDDTEEINAMMESIRTLMPKDKQQEAQAKDGPGWLRAMAESFLVDEDRDTEVRYSNGPHRIRFSGRMAKDTQAQRRFLDDFDMLQKDFPTGHDMRINVAPSTQFDRGVGGETTISTGSMYINERYLDNQRVWSGMPISSTVTASQYILAHEWGHSLSTKDEADEAHTHNHAIEAGGMTEYGTHDHSGKLTPREGYAEAFAEWALSRGKTTNPATLVYAEKFKWGERFGID